MRFCGSPVRWSLLVLSLLLPGSSFSQSAAPSSSPGQAGAAPPAGEASANLPKLERFDPSWIDRSQDPCSDFYKYTCSKWNAAHPIPPDMAMMSTSEPLLMYNQTILRRALERAAADQQAAGSERQIGDFWRSCMDEAGRNAQGKNWLRQRLEPIAAYRSKQDLASVLAYLHLQFPAAWQGDQNSTKAPLFGFGPSQDLKDATLMVAGVDQGGMALPAREYYLGDSDRFLTIRRQYLEHVQKMLELAGDSPQRSAEEAKVVLEMETAFARGSMDSVSRRDPVRIYNKFTARQLQDAVPDFSWEQYLRLMGVPPVPFYIVTTPGFLDVIEQQIKTRSDEDWRVYLRWWMIHRAAPYLGHEFEQADFDFFATALEGTPQMLPPWRRCVASADRYLGEALGQAYVNIAFPTASKQRANQLVDEIRVALSEDIRQSEWMQAATRKEALIKQDATLQKIGYPDHWRDYSSVHIVADQYLANMNAANAFEARRQIAKIGKPVDRGEWDMTPPTINAYEDPQTNTINFPAGILQLPYFGGDQDDASNFGAIGMVIGHEAIHGFDDQGRKFDAQGNLRDWWSAEDAKRYEQKDQCIVDQYSQEIPEYGVKQDGGLTAGEDTADNGGLHLAILALENLYRSEGRSPDVPEADGLTARQRFFLAFGFSWCTIERPEAARFQVTADPHSLSRFRVNRPLANMPEFSRAFQCRAGQPMVHAPQCRVW